jgi:branched-chain amino acid transport system permease protein
MSSVVRYWLPRIAVFAVFVAVVAVFPRFISDFRELQFGYVAIFFIAILGLNVLTGYTGQISLGHGAFMMIGAYTTAILYADHGVNIYATIPLAALVAGAAGFVFGFPALRFSPVHLALATFGLAIAVPALSRKFVEFTGGSSGKFLPISFPTGEYLYRLSWGIALGMFVLCWLFLRGRIGRALRAVRDAEIAATSSGVNLTLYKTLAFGFSAAFAGVAGSLYGIATVVVSPELFPITLSILLLTGAVVAGLGSLTGILVGALFAQFVPIYAGGWVGDLSDKIGLGGVVSGDALEQQAPAVVYGSVLILLMFLLPTGFAGLARRIAYPLTNRLRRRQIHMPPRPTTPEGEVE